VIAPTLAVAPPGALGADRDKESILPNDPAFNALLDEVVMREAEAMRIEVEGECCPGKDWRRERNWQRTFSKFVVQKSLQGEVLTSNSFVENTRE
jgi:hypothetical protein